MIKAYYEYYRMSGFATVCKLLVWLRERNQKKLRGNKSFKAINESCGLPNRFRDRNKRHKRDLKRKH